jgi:hypothetical protein
MKRKLVKKRSGGVNDPVRLKEAKLDSTVAAKFKASPAYAKADAPTKKVVEMKMKSPANVRAGKPDQKYGSTPIKYIPLQKKGGSVKKKK